MPNLLQYEKSPYLLQHAENPVAWRPWGGAALEEARREDKPIFLSIGYSTCHWCHVMAHESFESEEVAAALNRSFIPIKVDREERPDVDAVYMAACVALSGSGGWPLTVLLTPEQKPFWAGTYLPKAQLLALLTQAAHRWRENREELTEAAGALTEYLRREEPARPGAPGRPLVETGAVQFARSFDAQWGGFGEAPKFPAAHNLLFLLRYSRLTGDRQAREMAELTLERMYRGGLFDHVGGGFCRYATDRRWLVPHFEKMLYDNALLALAYTESWQQTRREYCRDVARRTLDYVLAELTDPLGGFYCGQDADSDGVEGRYYVFTPEEIAGVLGREAAEGFCRRFGVTAGGNFEGRSIPSLIGAADWEREPEEMEALRQRLYDYRKGRAHLHRDDKVLTAWNGLMIAALARAGLILDEPRYLAAAERAVRFIRENLKDGGGRLLARWREGEAAHPGKLEDYAFYAWGLLELYEATFRIDYLEEACALAQQLLELFFDSERGGFYPYARDGEQLITRSKEVYDGAMPSGNAAAALVLHRLARLTGEERWREAAEIQLSYLAGAAEDYPAGHSFTLLTLLEELWPTAELVCAAKAPPEELAAFLREKPRPNLTVLVKTAENEARLAALAPFTAGYPIPEVGARYYLCRGKTCASPVEHIEDLAKLLS
ncbi:MAG: thioredoxin domain-containing protein [Oscillospiraceae bacterium]